MKLRDNFPNTEEQAAIFQFELVDNVSIGRIFEIAETTSLTALEETINDINKVLLSNRYEAIDAIQFVKDDFSYTSKDGLVSLSRQGNANWLNLTIVREDFFNLNSVIINLLNEFFQNLRMKVTDSQAAQRLNQVLDQIKELPQRPEYNTFVSFEYESCTYYISFSDYKIEFSKRVRDFESYEANRFLYEIEGYTDATGSFDQFREELLQDLKNVAINEISISDEE